MDLHYNSCHHSDTINMKSFAGEDYESFTTDNAVAELEVIIDNQLIEEGKLVYEMILDCLGPFANMLLIITFLFLL